MIKSTRMQTKFTTSILASSLKFFLIAAFAVIAIVGCAQDQKIHPKLDFAQDSDVALVNRALQALRENDPQALNALRITRYEHDSILAPMTRDSAWVANFDLDLAWSMLNMSCVKGVQRALGDFAGDPLTLVYLRYRDTAEVYSDGALVLHRKPAAVLRDEATGEEFESWMFGTIMELDGQFKFISIRD